jgi:hypothetical protein
MEKSFEQTALEELVRARANNISKPRLASQLGPAVQKLMHDSAEHGQQAASLLPQNIADAIATFSAIFSLVTLMMSAFYAGWALVKYIKSRNAGDAQ